MKGKLKISIKLDLSLLNSVLNKLRYINGHDDSEY